MKHITPQTRKFRELLRTLRPHITLGPIDPETILVGLLERLWINTAISAKRGDIGKFTDAEIAEMMGWHMDANVLIDALVLHRWLDRCDEFRLVVHDWSDHAPNFVKGNAKRLGGWAQARPPSAPPKRTAQAPGPSAARQAPCAPNQTKPNQTSSPSPPHDGDASPAADSGGPPNGGRRRGINWEDAIKTLAGCGVKDPHTAIETAREHRLTPEHVDAIATYWAVAKDEQGWTEGALFWRVCHGTPDMEPIDGWPGNTAKPVDPEAKARAAAAERTAAAAGVLATALRQNWTAEQVEASLATRGLSWSDVSPELTEVATERGLITAAGGG